jgi:hypothetical protein
MVMGDDRNRILDLLASGRITVEEATRLLDALEVSGGKNDGTDAAAASAKTGWPKFFASGGKDDAKAGGAGAGAGGAGAGAGGAGGGAGGAGGGAGGSRGGVGSGGTPKYMFVKVVSEKGDNVNVKIPLGLLRAGLKLTALIPKPASDQINKAMADKGMSFDLNSLKPEDIEELIGALAEMEVEVDSNNGDTVRVFVA